jgi:phosphate transport system substrate-binding protein
MKTSKLFLILPLIGMLSCGKAKLMMEQAQSNCCICNYQRVVILFCHWHKEAEELMKTNSDVSVTVVVVDQV